MADKTQLLPFLVVFLVISKPTPSASFSYGQIRTLFSLAHSLMTRVGNLRASRGDESGAERARLIAAKLEHGFGLGFWGTMWSVGWDYIKNYGWRGMGSASAELLGAVSDLNELLRSLNELTRLESVMDRKEWVSRNYQDVLRVSRSFFRRLLLVFRQSGALRELVETVQKEVEGGLLGDCLELGSSDLKGWIQAFKDLVLQFSSTSNNRDL